MLKDIRLQRYKGFADFSLHFGSKNVLIGPNNAGKTTLVTAIKLLGAAASHARRHNPVESFRDPLDNRAVTGHRLEAIARRDTAGFVVDNIHYMFGQDDAAITAHFNNGASLRIVWPGASNDGLFYVERFAGALATNASQAKACLPQIGVVPVFTPLEDREDLLNEKYVLDNQGARLSSRHFRNQLWILSRSNKAEYDRSVAQILANTPEISGLRVAADYSTGAIDLFYVESDSGREMEVFWAGDGIQIWTQLVFHLHRMRNSAVLVLDEPDVYLHPDLQRRLVGILEEAAPQTVVATHAPEMLTEAARETVVWIDRKRRHAKRVKDEKTMDQLNTHLGSGFNLGIARALRSRLALFVEGQDMRLLRNLARRAGAENFARERGITVIPLEGFTNWGNVKPFSWMAKGLLGDAVRIVVLLDRDYRGATSAYDVVHELDQIGITCHVWAKKELESYLLVPAAISRLADRPLDEIEALLDGIADDLRVTVQSNFLAERRREIGSSKESEVTINARLISEFEAEWHAPRRKLELVPPKELISRLNERLQESGGKAVTVRALSTAIRRDELAAEVSSFALDVEDMLKP